MSWSITKCYEFEAAHRLPNHDGKCKNLHGHTYKLEVTIGGAKLEDDPESPKEGMLLDFSMLGQIVGQRIIQKLDHRFLNDVLPFTTTAENIAKWISDEVAEGIRELPKWTEIEVEQVTLWETSNSCATYTPD